MPDRRPAPHPAEQRAAAPASGGRRRLIVAVPALAAMVVTAACGGAAPSGSAPKTANEQAAAKPGDQKPTDQKPSEQKPANQPASGAASPSPAAKEGAKPVANQQWQSPPAMQIDPNKSYTATIKTSLGDMTAELFAKDAPNTVNNFVFLARQDFYDGVIFHRIISGFMVQTGDPTGTGRGGPGYRFNDELSGPHSYTKGTLAMANAGPNTQGSQFFICHGPGAERLPKNYTIFGRVTQGLETLDKIAGVAVRPGPTGENSSPVDPPRIDSIDIQEA